MTLDEAAQDAVESLDFSDLADSAWEVEVVRSGERIESIKAVGEFANPEQMAALLDSIAGDPAVFEGWSAGLEEGFAETEYSLGGRIALSGSVDQFGDDELAELLDGLRAGIDEATLGEAQLSARLVIDAPEIDWDVVSPEGVDKTGLRVDLADGESQSIDVLLVGTTTQSRPYLWIIGGGVAVVAAALLILLGGRKRA